MNQVFFLGDATNIFTCVMLSKVAKATWGGIFLARSHGVYLQKFSPMYMMNFRVGATTFSIITFSKTTLNIMSLFATLSLNNIQRYEIQHWVLICWVSLSWMMICWVSLSWMPLCWVSWRSKASSQVLYQLCYCCGPSLRPLSSWKRTLCGSTKRQVDEMTRRQIVGPLPPRF
jgi:hypothetical protein